MSELEVERRKNMELEKRLQQEMQLRRELIDEQVKMREKQKLQVCIHFQNNSCKHRNGGQYTLEKIHPMQTVKGVNVMHRFPSKFYKTFSIVTDCYNIRKIKDKDKSCGATEADESIAIKFTFDCYYPIKALIDCLISGWGFAKFAPATLLSMLLYLMYSSNNFRFL